MKLRVVDGRQLAADPVDDLTERLTVPGGFADCQVAGEAVDTGGAQRQLAVELRGLLLLGALVRVKRAALQLGPAVAAEDQLGGGGAGARGHGRCRARAAAT